MPQKTDIRTSHVDNSIINGKTMLNGAVAVTSPEPIESQQQNKTNVETTNARRLSTVAEVTAGMVTNPGRSNSRQTKNATISKVDDPVGNFRLSIDESVTSALLDCAYADIKHEVLGYLGGTCDVDRSDNTIVCRVNQFVASERIVTSLLTDEVQEVPNSRENAIKIFEENNLEFIGWYRSNFQSSSNSILTQSDIIKQSAIQSKFPNSAGFIVTISTTSCPSIGSKGTSVNGLVNSISVFRTFESPNINGDVNNLTSVNKTKNGKIWKGKGKANLKANKVSFIVNRQMYMCPNVLQQLSCALMMILRESRQTYAGQVLECENRNGQRIFADSQYESFLMNFLRKSVLQFDRSIDQDFRTLALAKLHVKSLISKRINDTLAISQNDKDTSGSAKLSKRRKLDKLIEKLVTQRMDKREKEMKKLEKDDVVRWLYSKDDGKTVDDSIVSNSKSEQPQKASMFSITEQLNQKSVLSSKKESSSFQSNNTKLKEDADKMDVDVVVIDSDSTSEIDVESEDVSSKSLLRKPSLDSSQLNPNSKRPKPLDSKPIFSSKPVQVNGNSSSTIKSPHSPSFLSKSPTFTSSSSTLHITVPNNNSLGSTQTTNGSQYYQYPNNITNGFRPFHSGPEELNASLRSPTSSDGGKTVNVSQGSGIHLPSIQGLLEISNRASMQPPPQNPLPSVVVVDPNSTIVQHTTFPTPLLPSFQNNHYYSISPNSSSIQHLHTINTSTGSTSTNSRHYIPIAPSPITTTTGGGNRPPPILQTSTSSSIYTNNNTTNHLTFPAAESDYQWKL